MSSAENPSEKTTSPPPYISFPGNGRTGSATPPPYAGLAGHGQPGVPHGFIGAPTRSGRATAALACAIISYFSMPVVLAVMALVLAPGAKREILASNGRLTGDGMVKAAKILAWTNIVGFVALVLLVIAGPLVLHG